MPRDASAGPPVSPLDLLRPENEAKPLCSSSNVHRWNGWILSHALLDRRSWMLVRGRNYTRSCKSLRPLSPRFEIPIFHSKLGSWVTGPLNTRFFLRGKSIRSGQSCRQYSPSQILKPLVRYILGYAVLLALAVFVSSIATSVYVFGGLRASRTIHRRLISSVLGATLRWLDSTPVSRVIARCTQDMQSGVPSPLILRRLDLD